MDSNCKVWRLKRRTLILLVSAFLTNELPGAVVVVVSEKEVHVVPVHGEAHAQKKLPPLA